MNAEALIGTVLGTCTLQKLIGQGGMGAVFLAQQSRPRRQVAVKVLLPMTPLSPNQLVAFLERFRRETDAAASLEHPNITPVHEYGERDGLAYLVMPYINGGTLRDELEREGPLPLEKVVSYLDQIAAALDFAHEGGVIHRDIKPANILMTAEGRLLLTDFGLVKIVAEGQAPQVRLTGPGAPVGTPDYMAPEQVIGEEVDARADLYSLGIILFQMITGTTPFQGETPMQIAAQHLQIPPPSPQMLRPDLPLAAEQVVLRALAKRPADRYPRAQDLANAFRVALAGTGIPLDMGANIMQSTGKLSASTGRFIAAKGLFDPSWQTADTPSVSREQAVGKLADRGVTGAVPAAGAGGNLSMKLPSVTPGGGLLSKTGVMPSVTGGSIPTPGGEAARPGGGLLSRTGKFPLVGTGMTGQGPSITASPPAILPTTGGQSALSTGSLKAPGQPNGAGNVKLTGPMKVVQVPVAGQPGRYVTGLLPVAPQEEIEAREISLKTAAVPAKKGLKPWMIATLVALVLVLIAGTGGSYWFFVIRPVQQSVVGKQQQSTTKTNVPVGTPNTKATAQAQATATAQANIILSDPLDQNTHNWQTNPPESYFFKDGAYHILARGKNGQSTATVLPANPFNTPLAYTLTMQQLKGDDTSNNNSFGMIFHFSQQNKAGKKTSTFYSFEVVNMKGGQYQFWKYDDGSMKDGSPWKPVWSQPFGPEFHQGKGAKAINTFKIVMSGKNFTFVINGKTIKTVQEGSLTGGTIGMIVNQDGTEVAFKNLLLTRN
jgi:serine/threonine protein kinase